ncbi:MAG TPA: hypothetical protein VGC09_16590 [Rhodopila sp.]
MVAFYFILGIAMPGTNHAPASKSANVVYGLLCRAAGDTAALALYGSLLAGVAARVRKTPKRWRAGLAEMHRDLAVAGGGAVAAHIACSLPQLLPEPWVGLLPFGIAANRVALGVGVAAFYVLLIAGPTYWIRGRRRTRSWQLLHLGSVIGYGLAIWHTALYSPFAVRIAIQILQEPIAYLMLLRARESRTNLASTRRPLRRYAATLTTVTTILVAFVLLLMPVLDVTIHALVAHSTH